MNFLDELGSITNHFLDVDLAIREYFTQILEGDFDKRPDLVGSRIEDVKKILELRLLENDRAVSLTLLAALESWFRIDCKTRAEKRERSAVGRRLKKMYIAAHKSIAKVKFEDILNAWSEVGGEAIKLAKPSLREPVPGRPIAAEPYSGHGAKSDLKPNQIIGDVKRAFKYRHWLAHGRYWTPKLGQGYNYAAVYGVANKAAILLTNS